jgi:hypothetical protein
MHAMYSHVCPVVFLFAARVAAERENLYSRLLAVMAACADPSQTELSARITATLLQPRVYLPSTLSKLFAALPPPPPMTPHAFPVTPSVLPSTASRHRPPVDQFDISTPHAPAALTARHQRSRTADAVLLSPKATLSVIASVDRATGTHPFAVPAPAPIASTEAPAALTVDVVGDDLLLQDCAAFILTPEHEKTSGTSRPFAANADTMPPSLTVNLDMCGGLESIASPVVSSGPTTPDALPVVTQPPRPPPLNVSVARTHHRAASTVTVASGAGFLSPYATARKKSQHSLQHLLQQAQVRVLRCVKTHQLCAGPSVVRMR